MGGPLVNVFWAAPISHDWPCFVNTNIGNEVLISLPPFSVLLVATQATETSGQRNRIAADVVQVAALEAAGKQSGMVRHDFISTFQVLARNHDEVGVVCKQ